MHGIDIQYYKSPVGELILGSFENMLCLCDWKYRRMRTTIDKRIKTELDSDYREQSSPIIESCKKQLEEYFGGKRRQFDIPLLLIGSDFQKSVWEELLNIPFGQCTSYLKLAEKLGNVKAIRAVASANGANSFSIIIPCHRVIGSDGNLVGYAGGLPAKKKLLTLEGAPIMNQASLPFE